MCEAQGDASGRALPPVPHARAALPDGLRRAFERPAAALVVAAGGGAGGGARSGTA
ncbi:hypothetical protein [Actinomadura latina]|uniref:Uncharacterized protein n=1 Tax=Actinomadura latina TaxID=163603 RepID=A0A846Z2P9_9ACTN|nr:hypothetical protein [Actinomadura latina]NKZ05422.1 hypothetical protein [Actinomadura latina]